MLSPSVKRLLSLREELVSLIDCRNSCDRAGPVIEDLVSHMRSNAEARHSRNACPAQIMKAPSGDLGKFVEVAFGNRTVLEWFGSMHSKYIRPLLLHALQDGDRLIRDRPNSPREV